MSSILPNSTWRACRFGALLSIAILAGLANSPLLAQQKGGNAVANATVNFSSPARNYRDVSVGPWSVKVEEEMLVRDAALAQRALARLEHNLTSMLGLLPKAAHADLLRVPVYLLYGNKSAQGGWTNGASYYGMRAPDFQKNLDPRWRNVMVIKSAENYVGLSDLWALKVLLHEFAHAHHLQHWPEQQPDILAAWNRAKAGGLYRNVTDDKGKQVAEAYALANQLEYFAELTCMYFAACNYPPRNQAELKKYDPAGYTMIEQMWGVSASSKEKSKPTTKARASQARKASKPPDATPAKPKAEGSPVESRGGP